MRILGIDPGSNTTGYGVLDDGEGRLAHVAHGTLCPQRGATLPFRLAELHRSVSDVIALHRPEVAVVERVFVAANVRSALVLGQARGVALAALAAAALPVAEYSAREIKLAATGSGAAAKRDVQTMMRRLLSLEATPPEDAADALAAALCHAHQGPTSVLQGAASRRQRRRPTTAAAWRTRR